jgi:hypothetical protein
MNFLNAISSAKSIEREVVKRQRKGAVGLVRERFGLAGVAAPTQDAPGQKR